MKIICIGRNYAEHAKEMKAEKPAEPVFFMKPETAQIRHGHDFYYPDFTQNLHFETELVIKICKNGRHIDQKFASGYYDEIGIGIDFTARDLQDVCKEKRLPWEKAKAFDHSAPVGKFLPKSYFDNPKRISFSMKLNGTQKQSGNSGDMLFSFEEIISFVSRFITLKKGDLIFTGTPEGVGPVQKEDLLECFIEDKKLLSFSVL